MSVMKLSMPGLRISVLALFAVCRPQTNAYAQIALIEQHLSGGEKEEAVAEALIRQRVEDLADSIHAKDIDGVMSLYASFHSISVHPCYTSGRNVNVELGKEPSLHTLAHLLRGTRSERHDGRRSGPRS